MIKKSKNKYSRDTGVDGSDDFSDDLSEDFVEISGRSTFLNREILNIFLSLNSLSCVFPCGATLFKKLNIISLSSLIPSKSN